MQRLNKLSNQKEIFNGKAAATYKAALAGDVSSVSDLLKAADNPEESVIAAIKGAVQGASACQDPANHFAIIKEMWERPIIGDSRLIDCFTILHDQHQVDYLAIANCLIGAGLNKNLILWHAVRLGEETLINDLISRGAQVNMNLMQTALGGRSKSREKLTTHALQFISTIHDRASRAVLAHEYKKINDTINEEKLLNKANAINALMQQAKMTVNQVHEYLTAHQGLSDEQLIKKTGNAMTLITEHSLTLVQALGYLRAGATSWLFQDQRLLERGLPLEMYIAILSWVTGNSQADVFNIHRVAHTRMHTRCAHLPDSFFHRGKDETRVESKEKEEKKNESFTP